MIIQDKGGWIEVDSHHDQNASGHQNTGHGHRSSDEKKNMQDQYLLESSAKVKVFEHNSSYSN
jgi:hypothetical protein